MMLRSLNDLEGYMLETKDGGERPIDDFLFDDEYWMIRYLVGDTGKWLPGRKVLISPVALGKPPKGGWYKKSIPVELTSQEIEESPGLETDKPVSRQYEVELVPYYGWPVYWREEAEGDPHLRSLDEVKGYDIQAKDEGIGGISDLILLDDDWSIKYLVVDTSKWNPLAKKVLVSVDWITGFDANEKKVSVDLTRKQVEEAPEYKPGTPVNRETETRLYDYYGKPRYWEER